MDSEEREVRVLAVEVLTLVNKGGHSPADIAAAREALEEAVRALRPERPSATVAAE